MELFSEQFPKRGLKTSATTHQITLQSFATRQYMYSGGGLQPAIPGAMIEAWFQERARKGRDWSWICRIQ
jgi:hypothetical protein